MEKILSQRQKTLRPSGVVPLVSPALEPFLPTTRSRTAEQNLQTRLPQNPESHSAHWLGPH
jgi:hypothetical protein